MPGTMRDISPGAEVGGYRIEGVIGRGGMGVVYRATQVALDRVVALKVITPEFAEDEGFRERFKRECKVAASIRHPNVITVHDARDQDGLLFVTMDYIEGTDLRALITSSGRLDPEVALGIIAQTASALDAAHSHGLVHRDVKPANILVTSENGAQHAYLTDFGLTKKASSQSGLTRTGMFVGTLDYIAPEQLIGGPVDGRADVYALGCVLFETLTGSVPFPRDNDMAKLYAHGNLPPPSLRGMIPEPGASIDPVVQRALEKDPNDRYPSAGEFARAAAEAGARKPALPAPLPPPPPRVASPRESEPTITVGRLAPPLPPPRPAPRPAVRPRGAATAWVTAIAGLVLLVLLFATWVDGGATAFDLHGRRPFHAPFAPFFLATALLPIAVLVLRSVALPAARFLALIAIGTAAIGIFLFVQRAVKILPDHPTASTVLHEYRGAGWAALGLALVILVGSLVELIATRKTRAY